MGWFSREKINLRRSPTSEHSVEFEIKKRKKISEGGTFGGGGIEQAIAYSQKNSRKNGVPVVLKRYNRQHDFQQSVERVSDVHKSMREDGLPVAQTMRFDMEQKMSVMTDFNAEGQIALSGNNESTQVKLESMEGVTGFEDVAHAAFRIALEAAEHGYEIHADSFFILYDPKLKKVTNVVFGDLDNVRKHDYSGDSLLRKQLRGRLAVTNLTQTYAFLHSFRQKWMRPEVQKEYGAIIGSAYEEADAIVKPLWQGAA